MNRIQTILDATHAAANKPGTFKELSIGARHDVVTSCAWRSIHALKFWEDVLDDKDSSDTYKKRAASEINTLTKVIQSVCSELDRMSHFSEGELRELMCDTAHADEVDAHIDGDVEFAYTVMNGNPYARGKTGLIELNLWPEKFKRTDGTVLLGDVTKTYDKAAGQYLGRVLLATLGKIDHTNERDARQVEIAACSVLMRQALTEDAAKALIVKYPTVTWVRSANGKSSERKQWSADELAASFNEAKRLDEVERFKAKAEDAVANAIKTTVVLGVLTDSIARMKEAGVSDALIAEVTKQITAT